MPQLGDLASRHLCNSEGDVKQKQTSDDQGHPSIACQINALHEKQSAERSSRNPGIGGVHQQIDNHADDDLYFDDGTFDEDFAVDHEKFDESVFDDDGDEIYGMPIRDRKAMLTSASEIPYVDDGVRGLETDPATQEICPLPLDAEKLRCSLQSTLRDQAVLGMTKVSLDRDREFGIVKNTSGLDSQCDHVDSDPDELIAAANANALECDEEGIFEREFGFYARPPMTPKTPRITLQGALDGTSPSLALNGGYFGTEDYQAHVPAHSSNANFIEACLTPITERSEMSNRNSAILGRANGSLERTGLADATGNVRNLDSGHGFKGRSHANSPSRDPLGPESLIRSDQGLRTSETSHLSPLPSPSGTGPTSIQRSLSD